MSGNSMAGFLVKNESEQITNVKSSTTSNQNYRKWLMGKSMEELESMPTADKLYMKVVEGNIDQIGELMKSMKLGESNVEVTKYLTKADG